MSDALKEKLNEQFAQDELKREKLDTFNKELFEKNKVKHREEVIAKAKAKGMSNQDAEAVWQKTVQKATQGS